MYMYMHKYATSTNTPPPPHGPHLHVCSRIPTTWVDCIKLYGLIPRSLPAANINVAMEVHGLVCKVTLAI